MTPLLLLLGLTKKVICGRESAAFFLKNILKLFSKKIKIKNKFQQNQNQTLFFRDRCIFCNKDNPSMGCLSDGNKGI